VRPAKAAAASLALLAGSILARTPTRAEISPTVLAQIGVHTPAGARLPLDVAFTGADGRTATLARTLAGRPGIVIFEDYRCTTLCGPALSIAARALGQARLNPGIDYGLVTIGLNPQEGPADAARMRDTRLPAGPLRSRAAFLTGDARAIAAETKAAGFGYARDPASGQYTHPVAVFVTAPDGRITRVLSEVNLTAPVLLAAIHAAVAGQVGTLTDTLALLCHGFTVAVGRFDAPTTAALRVGGVATLALMAAGVGALVLRRRGAA
jgi:protein SCO1